MKAVKTTWCLAGLMLMAGFSSASCGKDEGLEGKGGSGSIIGGDGPDGVGGKAGSGSVIGRGGDSDTGGSTIVGGRTGTGGGATGASPTKLGRACMADADCEDTKAPGLKCVTDSVGEGAPPGGLCTIPCNPAEQGTECEEVGPGALCYPFDAENSKGYCVEACAFGEPEIGQAKCHNRNDFACNPGLLGDTEATCTDSEECNAGEICLDGTCNVVFPGCLPSCRGDIDCAAGTYCDQSFLGGLCVTEKPTGKALGEPCTVPAEEDPSEPDECLGFCQADGADTNKGHCATNCGLLKECAWNSKTEVFDGACIYLSALDPDGAQGDFGFCMPACNCTGECNDAALKCTIDAGELNTTFKGPGLCYPVDEEVDEYNQCSGTGAGGEGSGGAGTGGVPSTGSAGEGGGG